MKQLVLAMLYLVRSLLAPIVGFREVVVLAYHSISDDTADTAVSAAAFRRQLALLKRTGHVFVPLAQVVAWHQGKRELPRKVVAVTFDDGYRDFETVALPVCEELAIPVTLFLVTDREAYRVHLGTALPMLDDAAVSRLLAHPLVELGHHTKTHPDVRTLSGETLADECRAPVPSMRYFAYPGGGYSDEAEQVLAALGYEAAFSIKPEIVGARHGRYVMPRVVVTRGMRDWELQALATMASAWYRGLRRFLRYG